jgi:hypothetical protein
MRSLPVIAEDITGLSGRGKISVPTADGNPFSLLSILLYLFV